MSSNIEWTDETWNPVVGCTPVSPGCLNCYAATMGRRLAAMGRVEYVGLTVKRVPGSGGAHLRAFGEAEVCRVQRMTSRLKPWSLGPLRRAW